MIGVCRKAATQMPEPGITIEQIPVENAFSAAAIYCHPPRLEPFNISPNHEERIAWVRKSCERFFEKVREMDAMLGLPELN